MVLKGMEGVRGVGVNVNLVVSTLSKLVGLKCKISTII